MDNKPKIVLIIPIITLVWMLSSIFIFNIPLFLGLSFILLAAVMSYLLLYKKEKTKVINTLTSDEHLMRQSFINQELAELSNSVIADSSLKSISSNILQKALELTNSDVSFITSIDKNSDIVIIEEFQTKSNEEDINEIKLLKESNNKYLKEIINLKRPARRSKKNSKLKIDFPEDFPYKIFTAIPLISGEEFYGTMFTSRSDKDYDIFDLHLFETLASIYIVSKQRIKAEKEIRSALKKEHELNALKTRFILMVSHEYRTPLTSIRLSADILSEYEKKLTSEDRKTHINRIRSAVEVMAKLLDDIILFNKAESGKTGLSLNPVNVKEFVLSLCHEFESMYQNRCKINVDFTGPEEEVLLDRRILKKIITNLLTNAVIYSDQGADIDVNLDTDRSIVNFEITDYGIGIPNADKDRIFEPFYRGNNVENISGSGLGLSIAKNFIDMMDGSIEFESSVGSGTTFKIVIPFTKIKKT